ncbi:MAG: S8 family serine peptidase, partial [Candidatus Eisenbacteria bacterium]
MSPVRRPGLLARRAVTLLLLGSAAFIAPAAEAAWSPGPRSRTLTADLLPMSGAQVDALRGAKRALSADATLNKIESAVQDRLLALARSTDPRFGSVVLDVRAAFNTPLVPVDEDGRLLLRLAGPGIDGRAGELTKFGVETVAVARGYDFLEAWVPFGRVEELAALPWVRLVATPGLPVQETGLVLSEGDAIHRADLARATWAQTGAGTTVGIISDGVTSLAQAQASADLPPAVQVGVVGSGDEGTAMLEIVHDLAPGAGLAFHTGGAGAAGMITAQNWLVNTAGARIVADDLWMIREPYFEDGPVALNAAALTTAMDVVYLTSAGNRAQRHIPQAFVDGGARNLGVLGASRPHAFGGADVTADILLRNPNGTGVRHTIVLQWGERFGLAARDFDLYLVNPAMTNIIALSTNAQAGAGDPVELIDFTYNGPNNVPARIIVDYAGALPAPAGMRLKIAANGPTFLEYVNAAGSINPHARHPLVYALGAIGQGDPGADTPEPFSSRGLADMLFPVPANRNKPDAMAIDGVAVSGVGGFPTPFFGTSAAAPHGAGIAALLRGAVPALTAAQTRDALTAGAVDLGPAGFDRDTGAGRLDAFRTLAPFLNQPPVANAGPDTTVECTGSAGTPVTLNGLRSSDPEGDALTYSWSATGITFDDPASATPTGSFPLGATTVTLTVSDGTASDDDQVVVTIADTTPPVITVTLDPAALWPPNHKLADIHATVLVTDACDADAAASVRLLSISSDEPDNGQGDGDQPDDIQDEVVGTADFDFRLRSEREGAGDGRTYTVCYEAEDGLGNVGTGCATLRVTNDQGALAQFTPVAEGSDVTIEGGWLEFAPDSAVPSEALAGVPDLGGDAFSRVLPGQESGSGIIGGTSESAGAVRWFIPGDVVRRVLVGAETATLFARFEV